MKIKFWEPAREYKRLKKELDKAIQGNLERGELVLGYGEEIKKFEKSFAKFIGVKHAIMTGSGTQSLFLAYKALGIGPGDEVITTSHTFIATIDQIKACGATPVLVDVNKYGLIDPGRVERAITARTKAIVPVHLEGKVCDMGKLLILAQDYGLDIIEDSAQAVGATRLGIKAGSMGIMGCFSFFPAKILGSVGNAGAITTDDDKLAERLKLMRCNCNIGKNPSPDVEWGYNMEPDAIQGAVLNVKMKHLPDAIIKRLDIAQRYDMALKKIPVLALPAQQIGRVYQDYVIRSFDVELLAEHLKEKGIDTLGVGLIPNHHYKKLGLHFRLPNTELYLQTQMRLPCNPDLTNEEVDYIIETIRKYYEK